jgi:ABC-type transport system involved in multi-copper enzyme maturation permease subunit
MLRGTLTLLTRSLRDSARLRRAHAVRLVSVLVLLGMLIEAHISSGGVGAPGLRLFHSICYLSIALISLAGLGFFASAIAEEKEEGTLGLLKLADLSTLSIVLGKSTSRLAIALVVFVGQIPFALLSITLGGLTAAQVWAAYVAMAAYLVLVANIALVWSVVCNRTSSASLLLLLTLLLGLFVAPTLHKSQAGLERDKLVPVGNAAMDLVWGTSEFFDTNSIFTRVDTILTTGFDEPAVSMQVWTNLAAALVCFVLACLVFNRFTEYVGSTPGVRGTRVRRWSGRSIRSRPGRLPLVWKDFYFLAGGPRAVIFKSVLYVLLIAGLFRMYDWVWVLSYASFQEAAWFSAVLIAVAELLLCATRIFHSERAEGTLPCLLVLPRSLWSICYGKLTGCLLGSVPTILMFVALFVLLPDSMMREEDFFENFMPACMMFLVLLHLTVFYSLIVRWGALPLAMGTLLLGGTCIVPIVATAVATIYTAGEGPDGAFGPVLYTGCVLSGGLQVAIAVRLRAVAAQ